MSGPLIFLDPCKSWKVLGVIECSGWEEKPVWNQQTCLVNCLKRLQKKGISMPRAPVIWDGFLSHSKQILAFIPQFLLYLYIP